MQGRIEAGASLQLLPLGELEVPGKIEIPAKTATEDALVNRYGGGTVVGWTGDLVEIFFPTLDPARVSSGSILSPAPVQLSGGVLDTSGSCPVARKFTAKILVMDDVKLPVIKGSEVMLHLHCLEVPCMVSKLLGIYETGSADSGLKPCKPRMLLKGQRGRVEITLKRGVGMESFEDCKGLGRFVLRRGRETVGMGVIVETSIANRAAV